MGTLEYGRVCTCLKGMATFQQQSFIARWNVSPVMPDFPLFQDKPKIQIFMWSLMLSNISNLEKTLYKPNKTLPGPWWTANVSLWVLNANLWVQLKLSWRKFGWVRFIPLIQSAVAMVHCPHSKEYGENSLRSTCEQECGNEHTSKKRSKDWGGSLRVTSSWMTGTLKANASEMW